ncbi:MAG: hypothetical protein KDB03_00605 [Planctomycetales bacterium]|nr:hypothetical protein [Planctomycetales bacterium]
MYTIFGAFVGVQIRNLCAQESAQESTKLGSVRGTVRYVPNPAKSWRLGRYYIANAKTGELAEAVVALTGRDLALTSTEREAQTVVVDQKNFQFTPETVALRAGDRIRFLNSDDHAHNVRTEHDDQAFNVTMPPGEEHVETFAVGAGINNPYRIDCVFHSAMRAWVYVFDHPWYQLTAKDGKFELVNIPPGEYRLEVVHPAGSLRTRQSIVVTAGKTDEVEIKLTMPD